MKSKLTYSQSEADEIVSLIKQKLKADSVKQKGIRARIRTLGFYASEFGFRDGYTVDNFLSVISISGTRNTEVPKSSSIKETSSPIALNNRQSDESYVIDLCDEILGKKAIRQHRFDFLRGDAGTKLPVDAYYPTLKLVVEYRELQHTETVKFFDRRVTASGLSRGQQRKKYDQLRRDVIPLNGLTLIEIEYNDFEHDRSKRIIRDRSRDLKILEKILRDFCLVSRFK